MYVCIWLPVCLYTLMPVLSYARCIFFKKKVNFYFGDNSFGCVFFFFFSAQVMHTKYAMATSNLSVDTFKLNYVSHQHQLSTESWLNFLARISITHTWGLAIRLGTTCNSGRIPQAIR